MTDDALEFGARLSLAMKLLNISRGALASEARADKSLVSRWVRGLATPRGPYLATLTEIVAARAPGFSQLSWDLPIEAFRRALDGEAPAPAPPAAPEPRPTQPDADQYLAGTEHSRPQSAREVEREGHAYPGVYAGFRVAFRNTGEIVPDLFIIWRRGSRLFFRVFDPSFSHTGEVFILRHQLFLVGEDDQRVDGLICYILNGVSGQRAFRLDGVVMTVANDRHRTPGAAPIRFDRAARV
jgi:transcriptional regulator with XRE-family HTH domain